MDNEYIKAYSDYMLSICKLPTLTGLKRKEKLDKFLYTIDERYKIIGRDVDEIITQELILDTSVYFKDKVISSIKSVNWSPLHHKRSKYIEIHGEISKGELTVKWGYDLHKSELTYKLVTKYKRQFLELVDLSLLDNREISADLLYTLIITRK